MITAKDLANIIASVSSTTCKETLEEIEKMGFNPIEVGETYSSTLESEIEEELNKLKAEGKFEPNYDGDDVWEFGEAFAYCQMCSHSDCKWWSSYH